MALVIEAIQAARLRLRDTATGKTIVQDVEAGGEWVCVEPASAPPAAPAEETKPSEADTQVTPLAETKPAPKTTPVPKAPAKAEAKPAGASKPAAKPAAAKPKPERKPAAEAKSESASPKKKRGSKSRRRDFSDPKALAKFEQEVLSAVRGGARTVKAIGKRLGAKDDAQLVPIVAALQEHIKAGLVVQKGTGAKATYHKPEAQAAEKAVPVPSAKVEVLPRPEVKLQWTHKKVEGRTMKSAAFDGGHFYLVRRLAGSDKLTYEKGETYHEYGCGETEKMKALAEKLARAGVPSPEVWVASGGDINACARLTRMEGVELEWREKVEGGRQICLAASGDGEFRLARNDAGSFILAFIRNGDLDVGELGCGTREALEARALDIAGQITGPAIDETPTVAAPVVAAPVVEAPVVEAPVVEAPPEPEKAEAAADERVDERQDASIMGALDKALAGFARK